MKYNIKLPMDLETRKKLRAGDEVYLTGIIYTARDAAHKRLHELREKGEPYPFDVKDAIVYYVGPTPPKPGHAVGSAGPTTATRMDPYAPELLDDGLAGMIGKGRRSKEVVDAIIRNQAINFVAVGGAGALLSQSIKKAEPVAFEELLSEAIVRLTVEDFPCFVGVDTLGNDIYDE
ncbi:MAG: Fe-S-containing hydro-lyase [Solobacterium sp.]|jgi:fumarate hydratase subunit beta|nr:Fe-S-containing hydro-lyase [Solobacterium sp.]MBQ1321131.1 Fe-S-containing hydro-lyase [Solobacterium sp.]MBQ1354994.1 Fe-S-containing hydro-lyase [Solobacterium sp.]MBQ3273360.1 Fe-S-containing hydro-lyase [Solobacterium sp.]MBQ6531626.1 Fe-S-containing hydro-lyase [Solobacterium sp.]